MVDETLSRPIGSGASDMPDDLATSDHLNAAPYTFPGAVPEQSSEQLPVQLSVDPIPSIPPQRFNHVQGMLLVGVIALAYVGQRSFARPGASIPILAIAAMAASLAIFSCLMIVTSPAAGSWRVARWLIAVTQHLSAGGPRSVYAATALIGSVGATVLSQTPNQSWTALGVWLVSIACALGAAYSGKLSMAWRREVQIHWLEAAAVVACVVVALLVRSTSLASVPPVFGGDEGSMGLEARDILTGRNTNLFVTGWLGMPRMSFLLMALPMKVWGTGVVGIRMHAAIVGAATILPLYWLLRPECGRWLAQCAIWLLATYPFHIHFSRLGANNIEDSFLFTAAFAAFFWGMRTHKPLAWALAGMCCGLSLYFYPGARFVIILAGVFVALLALQTRGQWVREQWRGLLIAAAVFMITGLPMLHFYATHWTDFNARLNQVGIIQNGWLAQQARTTGHSQVAIVWNQFLRTFFAYGFYRDRTVWYNDTEALLQFWPAALFPIGVAAAVLGARRRVFQLVLLWLIGIMFLGGALTESPPSYARLNGLSPVLMTLVALALISLARLGQRLMLWDWRGAIAATTLVVAAVGVTGVRHYFVDYTPRYSYGSVNGELATEAGNYLATLPPDYRAYFLGRPRMYYGFSTLLFLAPQITGSDVPEPLVGLPPDFEPIRPAFFFSVPEREHELRAIQRALPGGEWIEVRRVTNQTPLYFAYQIDRPTASQSR